MVRGTRGPFSTYGNLRTDPSREPGVQAVYNEFGRRLQRRLMELGWNQSELARRVAKLLPKADKSQIQNLDFGRDRISRYCRAKTMPRPESMPYLAQALGMKESDLIPASVPAIGNSGGERPAFEMRATDEGRVSLHINRTLTLSTATKIIELLSKEDRGA